MKIYQVAHWILFTKWAKWFGFCLTFVCDNNCARPNNSELRTLHFVHLMLAFQRVCHIWCVNCVRHWAITNRTIVAIAFPLHKRASPIGERGVCAANKNQNKRHSTNHRIKVRQTVQKANESFSPCSADAYVFIRFYSIFMLSVLFAGCCYCCCYWCFCCCYHCMPSLECWSVTWKFLQLLALLWQHRFPCRTIEAITIYSTRVKNLCLLVFGLVLSPRDVHDAFRAIETAALLFGLFSFTCVSFFRLSVVGFVSLFFFFFFLLSGMIYFPQLYYSRHLSTFHNTLPKMRSTS